MRFDIIHACMYLPQSIELPVFHLHIHNENQQHVSKEVALWWPMHACFDRHHDQCMHVLIAIRKREEMMNRAKTNCLTNCFSWAAVARCCTFRENSIMQSRSTNYNVCSWEMITLVSTPSEHQLVCGLLQRNIVWLCPSYRRSLLPPLFCLTYFDLRLLITLMVPSNFSSILWWWVIVCTNTLLQWREEYNRKTIFHV